GGGGDRLGRHVVRRHRDRCRGPRARDRRESRDPKPDASGIRRRRSDALGAMLPEAALEAVLLSHRERSAAARAARSLATHAIVSAPAPATASKARPQL